jgi:hypothetical protein
MPFKGFRLLSHLPAYPARNHLISTLADRLPASLTSVKPHDLSCATSAISATAVEARGTYEISVRRLSCSPHPPHDSFYLQHLNNKPASQQQPLFYTNSYFTMKLNNTIVLVVAAMVAVAAARAKDKDPKCDKCDTIGQIKCGM